MFRKAGSAEIIRSHQKDELYRSYLRSSVGDVILRIAGLDNVLCLVMQDGLQKGNRLIYSASL